MLMQEGVIEDMCYYLSRKQIKRKKTPSVDEVEDEVDEREDIEAEDEGEGNWRFVASPVKVVEKINSSSPTNEERNAIEYKVDNSKITAITTPHALFDPELQELAFRFFACISGKFKFHTCFHS